MREPPSQDYKAAGAPSIGGRFAAGPAGQPLGHCDSRSLLVQSGRNGGCRAHLAQQVGQRDAEGKRPVRQPGNVDAGDVLRGRGDGPVPGDRRSAGGTGDRVGVGCPTTALSKVKPAEDAVVAS